MIATDGAAKKRQAVKIHALLTQRANIHKREKASEIRGFFSS